MARLNDRHHGQAAIVIGGGPSAPRDFRTAIAAFPEALQFSANNHGYLMPAARINYAVHVDETHSKTGERMDEFLRRYGAAPILGRFTFDDEYIAVLADYGVDSGLSACWVAQLMGCAPVIPCGFDRWTAKGAQYFHKRDTGSDQRDLARSLDDANIALLGGLPTLRPISGPLLAVFPPLGVPADPVAVEPERPLVASYSAPGIPVRRRI